MLSLTDLALRGQREAEARALLQRFGEADATPSQLYRAAKLHSDLGDAAAGSAMLSRLPETSDDERRDKTLLQAQWLRDTGQPREAWDLLKPLLEREPEDTNVLYDAALAAEKAGDNAAMERYLRRIIEVDPKHYNAYNALGYSYAERGVQLNEARQLLGKALALSPDAAHLGEVLWAKGDKAKAEAIWQEGLETEPKHPGLRETMQRLRGAPVR